RDGSLLLTTSSDKDARVWSVPDGKLVALLRGHSGAVTAGAFSPDGRWVVTGGGTAVGLWQAATGRPFSTTEPFLHGHTKQLTSVSFSPDGRQVLTSSVDGSVRLYDCRVCGQLASLERLAQARLARAGISP